MRQASEVAAEAVGLLATATDHDARACSVQVDAKSITSALDLDPADGGGLELGHQVVADLPVLDDAVLIAAVGEPTRLPVRRDAESEPVGVDLLTHQSSFSPAASSPSASSLSASSSSAWLSRGLVVALRLRPRVRLRPRRASSPAVPASVVSSTESIELAVGPRATPRTRARSSLSAGRPSGRALLVLGLASAGPRHPARPPIGEVGSDARPAAPQLLVRHPGEDDRHVTGALADARRTAARPGAPALQRLALVGVAGGDVELGRVETLVVLGVRRAGVQQLADHRRRRSVGVRDDLGGAGVLEAADEVEDLACLGARHVAVAQHGAGAGALVGLDRHLSASPRALVRRGSGRSGSARTRRACGRPSTR